LPYPISWKEVREAVSLNRSRDGRQNTFCGDAAQLLWWREITAKAPVILSLKKMIRHTVSPGCELLITQAGLRPGGRPYGESRSRAAWQASRISRATVSDGAFSIVVMTSLFAVQRADACGRW
jgi:hypothetical protein